MELCFATNNAHKLAEVRQLAGSRLNILSLHDIGFNTPIPEDFETFQENALQKARTVFQASGIPCFADDSGLEAAALGGQPGVHSARYAGDQASDEENLDLFIRNMQGKQNRNAQFRCVMAMVLSAAADHIFEGTVPGNILYEKRGIGGFGYDPVFVPKGYEKTFSEMTEQEKNAISHRNIAFQKLLTYLINQDLVTARANP